MLIEQLQTRQDLTASERAIAEYILKGTADLGTLSTAQLAQATHTSKATITRLCKKLNLSSYRQFQQTLEKEQAISRRLAQRLQECPINRDTTYDDVLRILPAFYENSIYETALQLDKHTILKAMQRIRCAEKVDIYGSGVTQSIAQLAAFKFSTLGIECGTYSGLNEHAILADRCPKDKAIIMISLTGGNPTMIHVARWLKRRNYYMLGIGGASRAGLAELCSDYIQVPMEQNVLGMEIVKAFNGINYVFDILFSLLLAKDYDHNRDVAAQLLSGSE